NIVVNVSDAKVSNDPQDVLATYSLGSCIGVTLYDPASRVGGMLHFQLPSSTIDQQRARQNPLMFADTGMASLLAALKSQGAEQKRLKVRLAGAAQMLDDSSLFNIGRRNHAAIRKILWQLGLLIAGEDIGGSAPRNMYLNVADGSVMIKTGSKTVSL
ncbi:MAG TPA: chemotaxis protein CheD, partial [Tepidisphaeraceae bacterium]|nr:chemotaxis protein CheD [Tepidisphaeraceae bacterium]